MHMPAHSEAQQSLSISCSLSVCLPLTLFQRCLSSQTAIYQTKEVLSDSFIWSGICHSSLIPNTIDPGSWGCCPSEIPGSVNHNHQDMLHQTIDPLTIAQTVWSIKVITSFFIAVSKRWCGINWYLQNMRGW